ncbi:CDGSH iron-sulfur domain-containing protein 3, mitochondrial-like [Uloborus diversus]|uniref:CDGSH iron-sulfur domain-containing protein 3, mitochondrial-like n=1 Tax=Uloborus diversus TaxID=327109 RepID=UPI002409C0FE|nr:CDGSH iron-sulfur domain-containing protein 3, mitochondrial-like [Uloborus diversus]
MSRFLHNSLNILNKVKKVPSVYTFSKYCSTPAQPVVKGVIAKRIPTFVNLEKDKTYSWCSCGLSKKQPFCDGSHKNDPNQLKPVRFTPSKTGRFLLCRCKQTNNRPYCDLSHVKTFIPESLRKVLKIKL